MEQELKVIVEEAGDIPLDTPAGTLRRVVDGDGRRFVLEVQRCHLRAAADRWCSPIRRYSCATPTAARCRPSSCCSLELLAERPDVAS